MQTASVPIVDLKIDPSLTLFPGTSPDDALVAAIAQLAEAPVSLTAVRSPSGELRVVGRHSRYLLRTYQAAGIGLVPVTILENRGQSERERMLLNGLDLSKAFKSPTWVDCQVVITGLDNNAARDTYITVMGWTWAMWETGQRARTAPHEVRDALADVSKSVLRQAITGSPDTQREVLAFIQADRADGLQPSARRTKAIKRALLAGESVPPRRPQSGGADDTSNEAPPQTDEIYTTQKLDSIATSSRVQDI